MNRLLSAIFNSQVFVGTSAMLATRGLACQSCSASPTAPGAQPCPPAPA